jgi:tRNA threonylcarbamoyladenosine biosynthesis protein TsaB
MMALATGAKLVAVPTLDTIAQNALEVDQPPDQLIVMLDAKRGRTYAASFSRDGSGYVRIDEPAEVDPQLYLRDRRGAVMGDGAALHEELVSDRGLQIIPEPFWRARAEVVYALGHLRAERGEFDDPRHLLPVYVRPPEAEEKWNQRQRQRSEADRVR